LGSKDYKNIPQLIHQQFGDRWLKNSMGMRANTPKR